MKKLKQLSTAFLSWLVISLLFVTGLNSCLKPEDPADGKEDPSKPGEFDPTLRATDFPEEMAFPADSVSLGETSLPAE
ncbi:MAG TPA: hypothetical protein PKY83_05860 [Bacteroidales bacterium]|jgi:hypothetical protein|nr:hypothetical protein [Bacteroidales bacterium]MCZ2416720.1 hypothetical protein [Burkholderiales bacterium]MBP8999098.1 hypothetical protein [Bacteroidales bacterium]MCZ2317656.1 hypothetical protein [Bacteroidales bacterium]HNW22657.1 hypothetical protein [Bacteroidales bacterium]